MFFQILEPIPLNKQNKHGLNPLPSKMLIHYMSGDPFEYALCVCVIPLPDMVGGHTPYGGSWDPTSLEWSSNNCGRKKPFLKIHSIYFLR